MDGGAAGSAQSSLGALAATSINDVMLVYRDARDNGRSFNIFRNRSAANPLSFGADARIDADPDEENPRGLNDVAVAVDGAGHVYVAFSSFVHGMFSDLFVARSDDGGRTFGTPVRVGGFPASSQMAFFPVIAAEPGGHVYVAYEVATGEPVSGFGVREVHFNSSFDFGATWQPEDRVLDGGRTRARLLTTGTAPY